MKPVLVLLALATTGFGAVMEITIEGELDHGQNVEFFNVTPPTPFVFKLQYYSDAIDEDDKIDRGEFYSWLPVTFDFGDYHFAIMGSEVVVDISGPLKIFAWGNAHAFADYGLALPEYFGLYGLYGDVNPATAPTDELRWIVDSQDTIEPAIASYAYVSGESSIGHVRYQHTNLPRYTVREVPEPEPWGLAMLGAAALTGVRKRPTL